MKKFFYLLIIIFTIFFSVSTEVLADESDYDFVGDSGLRKMGEDTGYSKTIFNSADSLDSNIGIFITALMSFLGVLFLVLIIFGGIKWMIAVGNQDKIGKAKSMITSSIIGILIVLGAYAISYLVLKFLV
jgi:hypothetical protein